MDSVEKTITGSKAKEEVGEGEGVDPKTLITSLRRSRGIHKRKVTVYMKKLKELHENETLTSSFCKTQFKAIENEIDSIKKFDIKINNVMESHDFDIWEKPYYDGELDGQAEYNIAVGLELDTYENYINKPSSPSGNISAEKVLDLMSKINVSDGKPPH